MKYLHVPASELPIPDDVSRLIDDASARIDDFVAIRIDHPLPAFVPCEFTAVYRVLRSLAASMQGGCFVEWGAGFGVVATLAAKLGFDARGIEIQPELVDAAKDLATDHGANVAFACGSFVPHEAQDLIDQTEWPSWLEAGGHDGHDDIEVDPRDIDLVFAFPWPGESHVIESIFERVCSPGARLLTWGSIDGACLAQLGHRE